jgi:hypothetical protein
MRYYSLFCIDLLTLYSSQVGRWWCPVDGTGENMYSGPFILWNFESPEMDADEGCVPLEGYDETEKTTNTKSK